MGQLGDLSPQGSVIVGVFVGVLSTSVQSLGLTLQRKSHILEDEKAVTDTQRPPYRRRRWQLGMLLFLVSNVVGSTIQMTTLPLPVLSTLQASGLVFNSLCATLILGEPFTRYSFAGTILVCGGAVLIAIFGAIAEPAHNLDQLLVLLGRRQFLIWMLCQAILVVGIIIGTRALKILNPRNSNSPRMRLFRGMAYGSISGILSAHSLLVAKSAVELLIRTIVDRKNQFNRWQSWIILLGLVFLALTQLYYLHRGLKLCSTSILYPFVFCVYNIIAILDGLIYFRQVSRLSLLSALLIVLGTVILLAGVLALSWRLKDDPLSKTSIAQTPLTPGMGFLPADDVPGDGADLPEPDEESRLLSYRSPSLPNKLGDSNGTINKRSPRHRTVPNALVTRNSDFPTTTTGRLRRHTGFAEADEIWGELEEDSPTFTHPFTHRRSSVRSTPSHIRPVSFTMDSSTELLPPPNESTAWLGRAGTGRTYRDRRRRLTLPAGGGGRDRGVTSAGAQEALGGWWKMRWWVDKGKGKGKERGGSGDGDGNGEGGGAGGGGRDGDGDTGE